MPFIQIHILEGRPDEKVKELIESVSETVSACLEVPKDRVRVLVTEYPKTHWGIGGVPVSNIPGRQ